MTGYTDERKKSKKHRARVELAKTIVIVLLFLSMVTLASVEIVQTQRLSNTPAEIDLESLLVLHDERATGTISPYILPEFLGYSIAGVSRGLFGGETTMRGLYSLLHGVMTELLSSGVCRTLPADEGEAVWDNAREGDFVYVCYFEELPASAIAYAVSDGETELAEGDVPYIRELFVTLPDPGQDAPFGIVTRSKNGQVSVYSHKPDQDASVFDTSLFTAYNNSRQLAQFSFLGDIAAKTGIPDGKIDESGAEKGENADTAAVSVASVGDTSPADGEKPAVNADGETAAEGLARFYRLRDTTVLIDGEFTQKYITAETGASLTNRIIDSGAAEKLLELFGINTDRVAPYHSKGYTIYLGESGRVRFSDAGGIDYTAVSSSVTAGTGGVPVSSFLGYERYGGRYTYFELLTAAASLLDSLSVISPDLLGGEAVPGLISVSSGDDGLKLVFGYFYDNYRITGLGPAVTLTFADGMLTQLALTPASVTRAGLCVSLPQEWAIKHLYELALADDKPAVRSELTVAYNAAVIVRDGTDEPDTTVPETTGADAGETGEAAGGINTPESAAEAQSAGESETNATDERSPAEIPIAPDWVILAASAAVLNAPQSWNN